MEMILRKRVVIIVFGGQLAQHVAEDLAETLVTRAYYDVGTLLKDMPLQAVLFLASPTAMLSTEARLAAKKYTTRRLMIDANAAA